MNVVRHAVRSRRRRETLANAVERVVPAPVVTPDEVFETRELGDALATAIAALPHHLRAVFILCDLEELSGAEVAAALRVPVGTVFRQRHEPRRALSAALGDCG